MKLCNLMLVCLILIFPISARLHFRTFEFPELSIAQDLVNLFERCRLNQSYCDTQSSNITILSARVSNEYANILMHNRAQVILSDALSYIPRTSVIGSKLSYMLAVLSFSQGDIVEISVMVCIIRTHFDSTDIISQRCLCAHVMVGDHEPSGMALLTSYTNLIGERFAAIIGNATRGLNYQNITMSSPVTEGDVNINENLTSSNSSSRAPILIRSPPSEEVEDELLSLLLSEAQGVVRLRPRLHDVILAVTQFQSLEARFRFRLGVGLAKLGLYELSTRHVALSSTPWEAPLYRLRAKLMFPPVHTSLRALALAVDEFEQHAEAELAKGPPRSAIMSTLCNSLTECALALQALPLLHLAGYSAPLNRNGLALGHSPVALPVLLGEVFSLMCPPRTPPSPTDLQFFMEPGNGQERIPSHAGSARARKIHIGVVSGSMDSVPGRIILAILEDMPVMKRSAYKLIAMCLPTPRDATTDRANHLFDVHVNLPPTNKTLSIMRIREAAVDLLLFSDISLDGRVFALAHERLAPVQMALWGWGSSLGIPSVDYYIMPEALWGEAKCPVSRRTGPKGHTRTNLLPQDLFREQVVLFEGLPPLPKFIPSSSSVPSEELWKLLQGNYLIPPPNSTHLYLLPTSVRHLHPEFDVALSILLKTDPFAVVLVATYRSGRDQLPSSHPAMRHDLMHPSSPAAALAKVRNRLRTVMGEAERRVQFLPPLEEKAFAGLRGSVVAVLDPFPVGLHLPLLEALIDGVPVVSAPSLQECTHSHVEGLTKNMRTGLAASSAAAGERWPETPEEYAVMAMRLHREPRLRALFRPVDHSKNAKSHGRQLLELADTLVRGFSVNDDSIVL